MTDIAKSIEMLGSSKADKRYTACEELKVAPEVTREAITALQNALHDSDPYVAGAAQAALNVHLPYFQAGGEAGDGELSATGSYPPKETQAAPITGHPERYSYPDLLGQLRSWGIWMLVFGAAQFLLARSVFSPWGFLMVLVGLASFYFKTSSMYILYAVTLLWAAISNVLAGGSGWIILGLLQVIWCYQNFSRFFRYRNAEEAYIAQPETEPAQQSSYKKAGSLFPISGCVMGALSIIGVLAFIVTLFWQVAISPNGEIPEGSSNILGAIEEIVTTLAVLAFGISLAALLARYRRKALAILGLVASGLVIVLYVAVVLWNRLG